ncbi:MULTISPECIES: hypothetical protein [unclassified Mesorhizobium]|nr:MULTISPECIES: hypothetical protein [unclassified Mesorhizobium]
MTMADQPFEPADLACQFRAAQIKMAGWVEAQAAYTTGFYR